MELAKKRNLSFNNLVNYWLPAAVTQEETMAWMKRPLAGKDLILLIDELGTFLDKKSVGEEPNMHRIG
jgi:hypothetical protein